MSDVTERRVETEAEKQDGYTWKILNQMGILCGFSRDCGAENLNYTQLMQRIYA